MPIISLTTRVLNGSTDRDLKPERNAVEDLIMSALKRHFNRRSRRLQTIDLRNGQPVRILLKEITPRHNPVSLN